MSKVLRDHHNLRRNLKLNDKYISNDGGDEGIRITDTGLVGIGVTDPDVALEVMSTSAQLKLSYDTNDYFRIAVGADGHTTMLNNSGVSGDINIEAKNDLKLKADVVRLAHGDDTAGYLRMDVATGQLDIENGAGDAVILLDDGDRNLYFYDKGGEYISGDGSDLTITSGRHTILDSAGHVEFDGCGVGFDLVTPTYDATSTVVDFKTGNKQMVTFGAGNITNVEFHFPATSGNFVCLFKQDGTGSRTITNYKVFDSEGNAALGSAATKFAGGSEPTLTTDANHVDIISIFWDADNEIAYAVPSLDFQF